MAGGNLVTLKYGKCVSEPNNMLKWLESVTKIAHYSTQPHDLGSQRLAQRSQCVCFLRRLLKQSSFDLK